MQSIKELQKSNNDYQFASQRFNEYQEQVKAIFADKSLKEIERYEKALTIQPAIDKCKAEMLAAQKKIDEISGRLDPHLEEKMNELHSIKNEALKEIEFIELMTQQINEVSDSLAKKNYLLEQKILFVEEIADLLSKEYQEHYAFVISVSKENANTILNRHKTATKFNTQIKEVKK